MQLTRAHTGRPRRNDAAQRRSARPRLELLEGRTLLSTWTVTDNSDNPTDPGSLRYAILNEPDGTTINFAPTVGSMITLTNGTLNLTTNLDIEGPSGYSLGINGNANSTVFGIASGKTVTIAGLGIGNGKAISGGGIYNAGTLTLSNCTVGQNVATHPVSSNDQSFGGGIYNTGVLTVTNCLFTSNSAIEHGGGIYNAGTLTVNNCQFVNNSASTYSPQGVVVGGGTIANYGKLTINNSSLSKNVGAYGGGIENNSSATVTNCSLSLNNTEDSKNIGNSGGGIENERNGTLTLVNCTLAGNRGLRTGGIDNIGALTIVNCTIYQNNGYGRCGGLTNIGSVSLVNTIIAQNTVTDAFFGAVPDVTGTVNSLGYNLIGNTKGSNGWVSADLLGIADPILAPFGDYGGPSLPGGGSTLTMPPLPGSPAIGQGNPAAITNPPFPGPPPLTDQPGLPRIVNGKVDIGACESQGYIITVVSGDNQATKVGTAFAAPLVVSVASADDYDPVVGGVVSFFQSESDGADCTFPSGKPNVRISASGIGQTGRATIDVAANTVAGSYTVRATTISLAASAYFNLTNTAGAPYRLAVGTEPSPAGTAGKPFSRQPVILVEDRYGNLVTSDNTTQVTASLRIGKDPLLGTTTVTASDGIATFTDLGDGKAGRIILKFTSRGLAKAQANRVTVKRAPLARLNRLRASRVAPSTEAWSFTHNALDSQEPGGAEST